MEKNNYEVPQMEEISLEIEGTIALSCPTFVCSSGDGESINVCLEDEA